jgi:hypothetical protein
MEKFMQIRPILLKRSKTIRMTVSVVIVVVDCPWADPNDLIPECFGFESNFDASVG